MIGRILAQKPTYLMPRLPQLSQQSQRCVHIFHRTIPSSGLEAVAIGIRLGLVGTVLGIEYTLREKKAAASKESGLIPEPQGLRASER